MEIQTNAQRIVVGFILIAAATFDALKAKELKVNEQIYSPTFYAGILLTPFFLLLTYFYSKRDAE